MSIDVASKKYNKDFAGGRMAYCQTSLWMLGPLYLLLEQSGDFTEQDCSII